MPQASEGSDEISPELMRYLDRDYWEKKEKEKAELKAKALSDVNTTSLEQTKSPEELSKTTTALENRNNLGILKI